jgi:hypothetical protein
MRAQAAASLIARHDRVAAEHGGWGISTCQADLEVVGSRINDVSSLHGAARAGSRSRREA